MHPERVLVLSDDAELARAVRRALAGARADVFVGRRMGDALELTDWIEPDIVLLAPSDAAAVRPLGRRLVDLRRRGAAVPFSLVVLEASDAWPDPEPEASGPAVHRVHRAEAADRVRSLIDALGRRHRALRC